MAVNIPSAEGEAGQLLRVKLMNFMSHENFEVYFKRYVNLIHGENGSGKSAIMQAIQLCLGARAKQAGRGKSSKIKDFVKHGTHAAIMQVSVWNTGLAAYEPQRFGRVITIERKISDSGQSTYFLYDAQWKKVPARKDKVDEIMDFLNICGHNPIVMLTQDRAREFLKERNLEKSLYKLYMQATQFQQTLMNMNSALENVKIQKEGAMKQLEKVQKVEKEMADLDSRIKIWKDAEQTSQRLRHLRLCFPYIQVAEWERMVEVKKAELEEVLKPKIAEIRTNLEEKRRIEAEAKESQLELRGKMEEFRTVLDRKKREIGNCNQKKSVAQKKKNTLVKNVSELEQAKKAMDNEKAEYERAVESNESNFQENFSRAKRDHDQRISQSQENLESVKAGIFRHNQSLQEFEAQVESTTEQYQNLDFEIKRMTNSVGKLKSDIQSQKISSGDKFSKFGPQIRGFCESIERNKHRFHAKPVGPIGLFLALTDDAWGVAVEFAVGSRLDSFIVTDFHDKNLLAEMARRSNLKNQIIIYDYKNGAYDLEAPLPGVLTVLQVLRFVDSEVQHVVKNVLIDTCMVEATALSDNEDSAIKLVRRMNGDQYRSSKNRVSTVYLPDGRKIYMRRGALVNMHEGYILQARLVKDRSRVIRQMEERLAGIENEVRSKQDDQRLIRERLNSQKREVQRAKQRLEQCEKEEYNLETQLDQLNESGPTLEEAGEGIRDMQARILDLTKSSQDKATEIANMQEQLRVASEELEEVKKEMQATVISANEEQRKFGETSAEISERNSVWAELNTQVSQLEADLADNVDNMENVEKSIDDYMEPIKEAKTEAEQSCTREEFEQSLQWLTMDMKKEVPDYSDEDIAAKLSDVDWVKKKAKSVERRLQKAEREAQGSPVELEDQQNKKEAEHDKLKAVHQELRVIYDVFNKMYRVRAKMFNDIRDTTDKNVDAAFKINMKRRGHTGNVIIDHGDEILQLKVLMQGQNSSVEDMRSLSGGEKSFTTVSFVLSLAAIIRSPFYAMDEFDVYMDAVNRKLVLEALLTAAYEHKKDSQYIFFTPLPTGALEVAQESLTAKLQSKNACLPDDFVSVLRLKPPRPNTQTQPQT
ncbi:hypothetical protein BSKO_01482 [Bryopsis sp. KO-2023]|nr:hypothetical protein BSKO_01482 [Bryopsis sp. KO-2023]